MNCLNICPLNTETEIELFILAVIDCLRIDWHSLYINKNTTGYIIYNYFKNYYNKELDIDLDIEGRKYKLENINSIQRYIKKNPDRMCLYIYTFE